MHMKFFTKMEKEGKYYRYHESGKVREEVFTKMEKEGKYYGYHESGKVSESFYKNGKRR